MGANMARMSSTVVPTTFHGGRGGGDEAIGRGLANLAGYGEGQRCLSRREDACGEIRVVRETDEECVFCVRAGAGGRCFLLLTRMLTPVKIKNRKSKGYQEP